MATALYVFDNIILASGTLKISIATDATAFSSPIPIHGDYLLKSAHASSYSSSGSTVKKQETVEVTGVGGVAQINSLDLEFYDRGNIFRDNVFNRDVMHKATARIILNVNGTDYEILYGDIDLSTVYFPSYSDDEAFLGAHSCKFTVLSKVSLLDSYRVWDDLFLPIYQSLDPAKIYHDVASGFYYFNLMTLMDIIMGFVGVPINPSAHQIAQVWTDGTTQRTFDGLYVKATTGALAINPLWQKNVTDSFIGIPSLKELLKTIAGMFLAYPDIVYDPLADKFQLTLKQRTNGPIIQSSNLGSLKGATLGSFYGYDGIRVEMVSAEFVVGYPYAQRNQFPQNMTDLQFDRMQAKFDFKNYLALGADDVSGQGIIQIYMKNAAGNLVPATHVLDGATDYTYTGPSGQGRTMDRMLFDNFLRYWRGTNMWERTYRGTGIGVNPLNILDRVAIGGRNWSVIDIQRDIVANEMTAKMVKL